MYQEQISLLRLHLPEARIVAEDGQVLGPGRARSGPWGKHAVRQVLHRNRLARRRWHRMFPRAHAPVAIRTHGIEAIIALLERCAAQTTLRPSVCLPTGAGGPR